MNMTIPFPKLREYVYVLDKINNLYSPSADPFLLDQLADHVIFSLVKKCEEEWLDRNLKNNKKKN